MLQLINRTPFYVDMLVLPDEEGIDSLYIIIKASFTLGAQWTLAEVQAPPCKADEYWGEPNESSLKYPSDYHLGKPATDIIMLGHACAPANRSVQQLDVRLVVGRLSKVVRVFGDRVWQSGRISHPVPFQTMPLVYERAFGGSVRRNGAPDGEIVAAEARNPLGMGYGGNRGYREMDGVPLPNLEDPRSLIRTIDDVPEPACFGARAPNWRPRVQFAGTYDEQWQRLRAPYLPHDYDSRFLNAAHPELVYDGFLQGGESVEITNMRADGDLRFSLPHIKLAARVAIGAHTEMPVCNLETLLLEPNELRASMVWKAKVRCDKKALKIKEVSVNLTR